MCNYTRIHTSSHKAVTETLRVRNSSSKMWESDLFLSASPSVSPSVCLALLPSHFLSTLPPPLFHSFSSSSLSSYPSSSSSPLSPSLIVFASETRVSLFTQPGLKLGIFLPSASHILRLQDYTTMPVLGVEGFLFLLPTLN